MLDIFRKQASDHVFLEKVGEVLSQGAVENARAETVLKEFRQGKD